MKTLAYHVDITALFNAQDSEKRNLDSKAKREQEEGAINKERLLKIVLPYLHGVMALHNRKCTLTRDSTTGCIGLLGLNKVDIQKEIDYIVNTDSHHVWQDNFQTFTFDGFSGNRKIKIWLNSRIGSYKYTPRLEYSMTSVNSTYGTSIEHELIEVAKLCAKYTDDWK